MVTKKLLIVTALSLTLFLTSSLLAQTTRTAPDPIQTAVTKAMREGRLADAGEIITSAIQELQKNESNTPRLADYLMTLSLILLQKQQYADAVVAAQHALQVDKDTFGETDIRVASDMSWIAGIDRQQGKLDHAEQLLKQSVDIVRLHRDTKEDEVTIDRKVLILASLWEMYVSQQRWAEAEPLILQGLSLCKSMRFPPPPCESAQESLSRVYKGEGKTPDPETSPADPAVPREVANLNNAAERYESDGAYAQAEDAYNNAITWLAKNPQPGFHDLYAFELASLARVLQKQGLNDQAETAYLRAIAWKENAGASSPPGSLVIRYFDFSGLIALYRSEGRLKAIEPVVRHTLEIQEQFLGPRDIHLCATLVTLANAYQEDPTGNPTKWREAAALYSRAINLQEANLGPDHPELLATLAGYADLLRRLNEDSSAAEVQSRIDRIQKKLKEQTLRF
jgi:tetratricopeptide (TPR) repeat protein